MLIFCGGRSNIFSGITPEPSLIQGKPVTSSPAACNILGYACVAALDYTQAGTHFSRCIELEPGHVRAILGLALVSHYTKGQKTAAAYLSQAVSLKPVLKEGVEGLEELKAESWYFSEKDKDALIEMLDGL